MYGDPRQSIIGFLFVICTVTNLAIAEIPSTWIDDAQLHDVQIVSSKLAFAVGEHGTIWKSENGGYQWNRLNCGLDVSLSSLCFLTDQVGWVAGRDVNPYSNQVGGVLLATQDGGRTWNRFGRENLPNLTYVKFFDLDEGLVVGQATPLSPTGIYKTSDGGKNWRGVQGEAPHPWRASSFFELEKGAVAGVNGRVSLMGGDRLFDSKMPARGLRSIRAIHVSPESVGWLAGDGGLVLRTSNGGIVWEAPSTQLPEELRDGMDFRAVEVRGDNVWLAGSPGRVIWHSADQGHSWLKQSTGQSVPISKVRFSNDHVGIAVGAFGLILRTENGGKTWETVRGHGRRAAFLSLHARTAQANAPLIAKLSGESGYRSTIWIAERDDLGPLASATDGELRLQSAVQKCGGNASDIHWQLPVTVPGVEYSTGKLTEEWQKQTEGRLSQTLLGTIVRQIRTWRPSVVFIDQPTQDDAASQLLYDAVQRAIEHAADPTRFAEQTEITELDPWKVDRVYMKLAPGATGDAQVLLDEFLPYLKSSTRIVANPAVALLQSGRVPTSESSDLSRIAYRLLNFDGNSDGAATIDRRKASTSSSFSRDFFASLSIAPGTAARRSIGTLDEASLDRMEKLVKKQRNFTAYSQKSLDDPRISGQMLGQLRNVVEGMEPQQAAGLLRDLADEYRKRSQFDMVESTYQELIHRYPKEPASLDAARWLIQFWCSNEVCWQRTKKISSQVSVSQTNPVHPAVYVQGDGQTVVTEEGVNAAAGTRQKADMMTNTQTSSPTRFTAKLDLDASPSLRKRKTRSEPVKFTSDTDSKSSAMNDWQQKAVELAKQLEVLSPSLFRSPEIQFPLATLRRTRGSASSANAIVRKIAGNAADLETKLLAERELWAAFPTEETPTALAIGRRVAKRPHLDGSLSDPCWEVANEVRLTETPATSVNSGPLHETSAAISMFAYDDEFLYLAFNVPRAAKSSNDGPQLAGRKHDADLSRYDRISILLDIDRDYSTWYEFQVDQRGWTSESCWEDRRWNPQWFVSADGDSEVWRVEAAIAWSDLNPNPPRSGTIFGLSILRTIPTVGLQSWTHPATIRSQSSSFGLLKLE